MIGLVVLRPERFEVELVGGVRGRRIEAGWHELIRVMTGMVVGSARLLALDFFAAACGTDARYSA